MTTQGWTQILFFFLSILAVTAPLGVFMYRVLEGESHFLKRPLGWLERLVYRLGGVDGREQTWQRYTGGLLAFSALTMLVTYAIQRLQHLLPFNPQKLGAVEAASAFNTAASFTTNTNWQGYVGEATMSYLSQMAGLAWHNFISAAAGIAVAVALARGLTRRGEGKGTGTLGNFWVDLTRATVYILLPICVVFALLFVSQGMIAELCPPTSRSATLEGAQQTIAMGPVASQEAIKQLGTNGRGAADRPELVAHHLPIFAVAATCARRELRPRRSKSIFACCKPAHWDRFRIQCSAAAALRALNRAAGILAGRAVVRVHCADDGIDRDCVAGGFLQHQNVERLEVVASADRQFADAFEHAAVGGGSRGIAGGIRGLNQAGARRRPAGVSMPGVSASMLYVTMRSVLVRATAIAATPLAAKKATQPRRFLMHMVRDASFPVVPRFASIFQPTAYTSPRSLSRFTKASLKFSSVTPKRKPGSALLHRWGVSNVLNCPSRAAQSLQFSGRPI